MDATGCGDEKSTDHGVGQSLPWFRFRRPVGEGTMGPLSGPPGNRLS